MATSTQQQPLQAPVTQGATVAPLALPLTPGSVQPPKSPIAPENSGSFSGVLPLTALPITTSNVQPPVAVSPESTDPSTAIHPSSQPPTPAPLHVPTSATTPPAIATENSGSYASASAPPLAAALPVGPAPTAAAPATATAAAGSNPYATPTNPNYDPFSLTDADKTSLVNEYARQQGVDASAISDAQKQQIYQTQLDAQKRNLDASIASNPGLHMAPIDPSIGTGQPNAHQTAEGAWVPDSDPYWATHASQDGTFGTAVAAAPAPAIAPENLGSYASSNTPAPALPIGPADNTPTDTAGGLARFAGAPITDSAPSTGGGAAPASLPQQSGTAIGAFGPGNDLRFDSILPQTSTRLGDTQSAVENAAAGLQGPDRTALAQQAFDLLNAQGDKQFNADLRTAGQSDAALGRLGSGPARDDLRNVVANRATSRDQLAQALALDTAGQQLSDQQGVLSSLTGLEGQQSAEDAANRAETRDERNYQYGVGQDAQNAAINQTTLQDQLTNSQFNRDQQTLATLLSAAYGGSLPTNALLTGAGNDNASAAQGTDAYAELLQQLGIKNGYGGSAGTSSTPGTRVDNAGVYA